MHVEALIIDDTLEICTTLQTILMHLGISSKYFLSSKPALEYFETERNRIAFVDVNLPIKNGIEILREIKQSSPETQVIMMTGEREIHFVISSINHKANDFLLKPFNKDSIQSVVEKATHYLQMMQQREEYRIRIEKEIKFAAKIQKKLLSVPMEESHCVAETIPCAGGITSDFYTIQTSGKKKFLVLGDIEGREIASGFIAYYVSNLVKELVASLKNAEELLKKINTKLLQNLGTHSLQAFAFLIEEKTLNYSTGGMQPAYLFRTNGEREVLQIESNEMVGIFPNANYQSKSLAVAEGDLLFVHSNGLLDPSDTQNYARFGELLQAIGTLQKQNADLTKIRSQIREYVQRELEITKDDSSFILLRF